MIFIDLFKMAPFGPFHGMEGIAGFITDSIQLESQARGGLLILPKKLGWTGWMLLSSGINERAWRRATPKKNVLQISKNCKWNYYSRI